eukprot:18127-Heterococcus_DN1.PRE.4
MAAVAAEVLVTVLQFEQSIQVLLIGSKGEGCTRPRSSAPTPSFASGNVISMTAIGDRYQHLHTSRSRLNHTLISLEPSAQQHHVRNKQCQWPLMEQKKASSGITSHTDCMCTQISPIFKSPESEGNRESIRDVSTSETHHKFENPVGALIALSFEQGLAK